MESKIFIQPQPKYDVVVSNTSDIPNLIITKAKEKMVVTIAAAIAGKGREILFQVNETHIQWQYTGEETWTNLIAIADLKGVDGSPGYTPIKGTDYWTEQDKQEIVQDVLQEVADNARTIQYVTAANLPIIGVAGVLYIDVEQNITRYWDSTNIQYVVASGGNYHDIKIINGGNSNG